MIVIRGEEIVALLSSSENNDGVRLIHSNTENHEECKYNSKTGEKI